MCYESACCTTKEKRRYRCAASRPSAAARAQPVGTSSCRSTCLTTITLMKADVSEPKAPLTDSHCKECVGSEASAPIHVVLSFDCHPDSSSQPPCLSSNTSERLGSDYCGIEEDVLTLSRSCPRKHPLCDGDDYTCMCVRTECTIPAE